MPHLPTLPRSRQRVTGPDQAYSIVVVPATAAATPRPADVTEPETVETGGLLGLKLFVAYAGTVTAATLVVWTEEAGAWYRLATATLDPAGGNEALDVQLVGPYARLAFQVAEITGGGTVAVRCMGVG